jgi:hypothetical protein
MASNKHIGSGFDAFLAVDGLLDDVSAIALKRVIVWQVLRAMGEGKVSKVELAGRMGTSRSQLDRFLDSDMPGMTLDSLSKAADALGLGVRVTLVPRAIRARTGRKQPDNARRPAKSVRSTATGPAAPARKRLGVA